MIDKTLVAGFVQLFQEIFKVVSTIPDGTLVGHVLEGAVFLFNASDLAHVFDVGVRQVFAQHVDGEFLVAFLQHAASVVDDTELLWAVLSN